LVVNAELDEWVNFAYSKNLIENLIKWSWMKKCFLSKAYRYIEKMKAKIGHLSSLLKTEERQI
jgi:hypothetical protein